MNLTDFYRHSNFMKDVKEGEKIIAETDRKLARTTKEQTNIKKFDLVEATSNSCCPGNVGIVKDIWMEGPYLRFLVDFDYNKRKKKHYILILRRQDVKLIS